MTDKVTPHQLDKMAQAVLDYAGIEGTVTLTFDDRFHDAGIDAMTQFTDPPRILLARELLDDAPRLLETLLHEAAHLLASDPGHGPGYLAQVDQLFNRQRLESLDVDVKLPEQALAPEPAAPESEDDPEPRSKATRSRAAKKVAE